MKKNWNDMYRLFGQLRANWLQFLAVHVAVITVILVLLAPLATLLLHLAVRLSGDAALSDQDIVFFVLSPTGFIAFIALLSILSIIVFLEYAALVTMAWLLEKGRVVPVTGVLAFLAGRASRLFELAVWILLRVLLYSLPFLVLLGLIHLKLLSEYDINYYLFAKPAEWYVALVLAGLVVAAWAVVFLRLVSGWFFCLPLLLLGNMDPRQSIAASVAASRGQRLEIIRSVIGWLVFSLALALLATMLAAVASYVGIPSEVSSVRTLLLTMGFMSVFGAVESFVISFISTSMLSLLILKLFNDFGLSREADPGVYEDVSWAPRLKLNRKSVISALVAGLLLATVVVYSLLGQLRFESETEVMAHRGASAVAPENTMAAIQGAIDSGAGWVEIDVQETADGEIVVIHDSDLKKVGGIPMVVAQSTAQELQRVNVGSWFAPEFSDQRIPTLREVLERCKDRIGVNIELKYYGSEKRLELSVAEIVDGLDMSDQVITMSLSLPGVRELKRLRPGWKVGLLSSVAVGNLAGLDVDFLALNARFTSRQLVRRLHNQGKDVMVWTVNDAMGMSVMASRGVDAIITDEPAMAVSLLEQRKQLEPAERLMLALAEFFDRPSLVVEQ